MPVPAGRLVFFQCKTANSFFSKVNDSSRVRTTAFASRMPMKFFRALRSKIFAGKTWYPLLCRKFYGTPNFLKHWRDAHETFRHCETKMFRRKTWSPILCIKFFDTPNFMKPWRDAHEFFRQCEAKKFRLKVVICHLLSTNFFKNQKFSGKRKGSFTKLFVSVLWDTKQFDETVMHPSSYARKFSRKEFFWNTKVFSNKTFWYSQTKIFSPENLDITPFFVKKIFHSRSFLKQRMFPRRSFFRSCEKKSFDKIVKLPPSFAWKISVPESFRNTEGFFYK